MSGPSAERLAGLDALRVAAAMAVMLYHVGFRMGLSGEGGGIAFPELAPIAAFGNAGVGCFFTLSGFVVAATARNRTATDFALRRLARLWPGFVVCMSITTLVLLAWPVPGVRAPTTLQWAANLTMVSRIFGEPFMDGAYWTIVYELVFYGWIMLLVAAGIPSRYWVALALVWVVASAANEFLLGSGVARRLLITEFSGFFAFGLALERRRDGGALAGVALALAAAWAGASGYVEVRNHPMDIHPDLTPVTHVFHGLAAVLLVALATRLSLPRRLARFVVAAGLLTYPFYLLHQHIAYAVFARFGTPDNRWALLGLLTAGLVAASAMIAHGFEPWARRALLRGLARAVDAAAALLPRRSAARRAVRT